MAVVVVGTKTNQGGRDVSRGGYRNAFSRWTVEVVNDKYKEDYIVEVVHNQGGRRGGYNQGGRRGGHNQGGRRGGYNQGGVGGYNQGGRRGGYNQGGRRGGYNQGGRRGGFFNIEDAIRRANRYYGLVGVMNIKIKEHVNVLMFMLLVVEMVRRFISGTVIKIKSKVSVMMLTQNRFK